jgi:hypothetical protein
VKNSKERNGRRRENVRFGDEVKKWNGGGIEIGLRPAEDHGDDLFICTERIRGSSI